jgi:hypothetical protein
MPSPSFNRKVPFSEKTTIVIDDFIKPPSTMDPGRISLTLKKMIIYPISIIESHSLGRVDVCGTKGGLSGSGGHSIARRKGGAEVLFK